MTYKEKIDKFTFLVPIFNLEGDRLENFKFVLSKLVETEANILVVEQVNTSRNKKSAAADISEKLNVNYVTVKINDKSIRKSVIINRGTDIIDTEFVWVNDCDCYLKFNDILKIIDTKYDFIQPYIYAKMLDINDSNKIRKNIPTEICFDSNLISGFGTLSFIYRKKAFLNIGGMNEDARGWGFEDRELDKRVKSANYVKILKHKGIHLYRPKSRDFDPLMYILERVEEKYSFSSWCEFCANLQLPVEIPTINKKSNKKSIIVDSRVLPNTYFTIKNTIQKLGEGWGHIVITSERSYNDMIKICQSISPDIEVRQENISSQNDYNNLFLSIDFWENLNCEYIFIYQHDSIMLNKFNNNFLKYDYVGSMWGHDFSESIKNYFKLNQQVRVGNGGFSVRKVQAMIDCLCNQSNYVRSLLQKNIHSELDQIPEDIFFSILCNNKPDEETALTFAIEGQNNGESDLPHISNIIGGHALYRYKNYKEEIEYIIHKKKYPTIYLIRGIDSGGASLYVDNLKKTFNNFYIEEINSREDLSKLKDNDTLLINHLTKSNISIQNLLSLNKNIKLHLFIHDFYFLNNLNPSKAHDNPDGFNLASLHPNVIKLFKRVKTVITNSLFAQDIYNKIESLSNKTFFIPPPDLKIYSNRIQLHSKIKNTINIGIISNITKCKGYDILCKIFKIFKYKTYDIKYHIFGKIDSSLEKIKHQNIIYHGSYNETEIFDLILQNNIHGLLLVNDINMPETYSYAATKCIISRLPTLYSDTGALHTRFKNIHLEGSLYTPLDYNNIPKSYSRFLEKTVTVNLESTKNKPENINQQINLKYGFSSDRLQNIIENFNTANFKKVKYFCISSPKAGSSSLYKNIQLCAGVNSVVHGHWLTDFKKKFQITPEDAIEIAARTNDRVFIFDIYREPIERIASLACYRTPTKNKKQTYRILRDAFEDKSRSYDLVHSHEYTLKEIFNKSNETNIEYDKNAAFSFYKKDNIEFYKFRLRDVYNNIEKINSVFKERIDQSIVLDVRNNHNKSPFYLEIKNNFRIPEYFFQNLFFENNCPYLMKERHYLQTFLSKEEYNQYIEKWEKRIIT